MAKEITTEQVRAFVAKMVSAQGAPATARALGLSREAVIRVSAGIPVRTGTLACVREYMRERDGK
jgi:hypothetical protein